MCFKPYKRGEKPNLRVIAPSSPEAHNELIKQIQGYSYASKADMKHMLNRCVKDLHELGFKLAHIKGLKPKHVHVLVAHWKSQGKNTATIKNYMSKLRKAAQAMEKPHLLKPTNDVYQIEKRSYSPKHNKAIHHVNFSKCTYPHIRLSIEGQALFGLRREESMKFVLSEAWNGRSLKIKPSWTKGGIGRTLSITNEKQRRYHELTRALDPKSQGLLCPMGGGISSKDLKGFEKGLDRQARMILTRELGHSRINITKIYIA